MWSEFRLASTNYQTHKPTCRFKQYGYNGYRSYNGYMGYSGYGYQLWRSGEMVCPR
jgi:hypothetical protein